MSGCSYKPGPKEAHFSLFNNQVLLGESVGGPFWVFLAFGDVPSVWTLASGALLITTLVGHEVAGMLWPDDDDKDELRTSLTPSLMGSRVPSIPPSPLLPSVYAASPQEIGIPRRASWEGLSRSPPSGRDSGLSMLLSPASREPLCVGVGAEPFSWPSNAGGNPYVPPRRTGSGK